MEEKGSRTGQGEKLDLMQSQQVSANPKENPRARVVLQSFPELEGGGSQGSSVIGYRLSLDNGMILGTAIFFSEGNPPTKRHNILSGAQSWSLLLVG